MDSKFVNKNKIGIVAALFLVIFLSQSKTFHFLMHTILGRFVLVLLVLGISTSSIVLGIVAVLFVVIMIYQDNNVYLEGFIEGEGESEGEGKDKGKDEMLAQFKKNLNNQHLSDTTLSSSTASTTIITPAFDATTNEVAGFKGREGFNLTERESNILKGKKSNEIPFNMNTNADNVQPSGEDIFNNMSSSF
jgi:uncharacterized membrane protein